MCEGNSVIVEILSQTHILFIDVFLGINNNCSNKVCGGLVVNALAFNQEIFG
jgi:hypothetical protein